MTESFVQMRAALCEPRVREYTSPVVKWDWGELAINGKFAGVELQPNSQYFVHPGGGATDPVGWHINRFATRKLREPFLLYSNFGPGRQSAGLISYRRGTMQVLDRPGLEKASCECYAIVKERFDAFLTPPSTALASTGGEAFKSWRISED